MPHILKTKQKEMNNHIYVCACVCNVYTHTHAITYADTQHSFEAVSLHILQCFGANYRLISYVQKVVTLSVCIQVWTASKKAY